MPSPPCNLTELSYTPRYFYLQLSFYLYSRYLCACITSLTKFWAESVPNLTLYLTSLLHLTSEEVKTAKD